MGVLLYSNPYSAGSVEYLFLISKNGDIHNKLYAYRLENGKVTLLPFKYEYKGEYLVILVIQYQKQVLISWVWKDMVSMTK